MGGLFVASCLTYNKLFLRPMDKAISLSILIADENDATRLLLKFQFEPHCKNIKIATNAKTAYAYLLQYPFDLILLSVQSPYFDGLELIKKIKSPDTINKSASVVAITTNLHHSQTNIFIEAGFDDCLNKPIIQEQLEEKRLLWLPKAEPFFMEGSNFDYVSAMLEKTSGDKDLATVLFNKLFSELQEQTQIIERALLSNDLTVAEEITHKLHGSVSFCGCTDIQALAQDLELSLSGKTFQLINKNFVSLKKKIFEFIQLERSILKQLR